MTMKRTTYYGSRISDNLVSTPEGFLICRNVPIARVGKQDYLGSEIGLEDSNLYTVTRDEAEVFSDAAVASFEGKPFTDEHPPDGVTPDNAGYMTKGAVQNVRRGSGENAAYLMADLIVYDANTIREIREGKREISCGYECSYEKTQDGYRQTGIVGNHVALVKKGRAGEKVAIKDQKPEQEGEKHMPEKRTKKGFWGNIIGLVRDNAPEDMETAMDEMRKSLTADDGELTEPAAAPTAPEEEKPENPVEDEAPGAAPEANPLEARLARVEQMLAQLLQAAASKKEPDALDALEEELQGTQPAADEEGSDVVEAEEKENAEAASDGLVLLKTMKPLVAGIKDPQQKKAASDTLARLIRSQMGMDQQPQTGAYGKILAAKQQKDASNTNDAADLYDLGRIWAEKSNPHYKKKEGK